jgi:hypothetical protein
MQVESLPAPVVLPEVSQPLLPPPPSTEVSDPSNVSLPLPSEESEQPTFHVMQPPPPVSIAPSESMVAPPSTTFTQLVAVPIASDTPVAPNATVTATATPTTKQTKRVCISLCSKQFNNTTTF